MPLLLSCLSRHLLSLMHPWSSGDLLPYKNQTLIPPTRAPVLETLIPLKALSLASQTRMGAWNLTLVFFFLALNLPALLEEDLEEFLGAHQEEVEGIK